MGCAAAGGDVELEGKQWWWCDVRVRVWGAIANAIVVIVVLSSMSPLRLLSMLLLLLLPFAVTAAVVRRKPLFFFVFLLLYDKRFELLVLFHHLYNNIGT